MGIVVNFAAQLQAAEDITLTVSNMQTQLEDLKTALAPMIAEWSGDAQEAYLARQTQWDTAASNITTILTNFSGAVLSSNARMAESEIRNVNLMTPS